MSTTATLPYKIDLNNPNGTTITDYSNIPVFKPPALEKQIADLQKEINELRQEITVIKTLLPVPYYRYSVSNASEGD